MLKSNIKFCHLFNYLASTTMRKTKASYVFSYAGCVVFWFFFGFLMFCFVFFLL